MAIVISGEDLEYNYDLMEMSNVPGRLIKVPEKQPFSFYFGEKDSYGSTNKHGIRIKFSPNAQKYNASESGILELHGDYEIEFNVKGEYLKSDIKAALLKFFKTYKVLFAGVWEYVIPQLQVTNYLQGFITLEELIQDCEFYAEYKEDLDEVHTIEDFERVVRKDNIFNMND